MKNHIAKNFKLYFRIVFIFQWIGLIGFIVLGIFGMWFFSIISIVLSFCFYLLRIVIKHHTVESFVSAVKNLNALDVLDHLPLGGQIKRRLKRKLIRRQRSKV